MRIYLDTEFYDNGRTIELISIGAVREDGREYYAETHDAWVLAGASAWLIENVRSHLNDPAEHPRKSRATIAAELLTFAGERPEWWAYYADYDWVVLCQLYGRMIDLPQGWPMWCRDLKQEAMRFNVQLPAQRGVEHHALADARWLKDAHEQLEKGDAVPCGSCTACNFEAEFGTREVPHPVHPSVHTCKPTTDRIFYGPHGFVTAAEFEALYGKPTL